MTCHNRWHVARRIDRDTCSLCLNPPTETAEQRKARKKTAFKARKAAVMEANDPVAEFPRGEESFEKPNAHRITFFGSVNSTDGGNRRATRSVSRK
jgi:hypothetical protein